MTFPVGNCVSRYACKLVCKWSLFLSTTNPCALLRPMVGLCKQYWFVARPSIEAVEIKKGHLTQYYDRSIKQPCVGVKYNFAALLLNRALTVSTSITSSDFCCTRGTVSSPFSRVLKCLCLSPTQYHV